MRVPFSERPGRHERHLRRRLDCPLFPRAAGPLDDARLLEAQRLDHEELIAFVADLRETVAKAASLEPNAGSESVLGLKESLERLYERSAGLAEDQAGHQAVMRRLLDVIVHTLRRATGGDPLAQAELDQAEAARSLHLDQLQHPLVADLLAPDSPIAAEELLATLLCEPAAGLEAALVLFDADQLAQLCLDARTLLEARDPEGGLEGPRARLAQMESELAVRLAGRPRN